MSSMPRPPKHSDTWVELKQRILFFFKVNLLKYYNLASNPTFNKMFTQNKRYRHLNVDQAIAELVAEGHIRHVGNGSNIVTLTAQGQNMAEELAR